jgi:poly-gamma-glutamate capsule biosynthesis protein CapA/YwtB (metallophosphatase superfamily)
MNKLFYIFFIFTFSYSEIKYESGDLTEFIGGNAPLSSYDNWLSHVAEGIATPGFNDYGPEFIDVQSNGFGKHKILNENSLTLDYWEDIFENFVNGDISTVDSLLQDSIETFYYNIIVFDDTVLNRTYHIIREEIDTSFIDNNQPENDLDDVIGSFNNSWGMYIISPNAANEQIIIQVPHPCDDFIAPYIAVDIFTQTHSFAFMINSVGREAQWSEEGEYSNNKSHSDPSRYPFSVFQKFQEAVSSSLLGSEPHSPLIIAVHSFDNQTHLNRNSVILAAGGQKPFTTKPIRDISNDNFDIINFTDEYPILSDQFGSHSSVHVTDYYEAFYDDIFFYDNGNEKFDITLATELKGPSNGIQMRDIQSKVNEYSIYESWIHIELDEKPKILDSLEFSIDETYVSGEYPSGINNFSKIREYYQPFVTSLKDYLTHWENDNDENAPTPIFELHVQNQDNPNQIRLNWNPSNDTNFKTYQIQVSADTFMTDPIQYDMEDFPDLQYMRKNTQLISGLNNTIPWYFRIRAIDYFNNVNDWSEIRSNTLPGHTPPDTILMFSENTIIESYIDQDDDTSSYIIDTSSSVPGRLKTLSLFGNTWKSVEIEPFEVDSSTVLQTFVKIDSLSEIQGILFESENKTIKYAISGTELLNIEEWIPVYQGSNQNENWNSYRIPLGDDWLSLFDSLHLISKVTFVNDHDDSLSSPGSVKFSFIRDITLDLPIPPSVTILSQNIDQSDNFDIITVSFTALIEDLDSHIFSYTWDFGDGNYSNIESPIHEYNIQNGFDNTVILTVEDESGRQAWASKTINLDPQNNDPSLIKINFVGDIMMGRRFEEEDGIISNQGANALFEPTYEILGLAADITVANLEVPLTTHETSHPTKGIVFKSNPNNINALVYAGIDVVSIANNHILDFMEPGLIETQEILSQSGILFSGAGMNSHEAYLPAFKSVKGKTIAFIASSDRTGQYNNYQPYLNAGENKAGFAYMTPYYLKKQIESVKNISDLTIVELHSGSEYSYEPGSDYDYNSSRDEFAKIRFNPASNSGFETIPLEEEDYSWRLDNPQMWDRAIRHFAIDQGADAVIVHHPHIIQGLEIYNGKLIAHSLGNFIFDLNYPETYPSMILNGEANQLGLFNYSISPIYIDDYLTKPASGELANYILHYVANQSKKLDTYLHVDTDSHQAKIIIDTLSMQQNILTYNSDLKSMGSVNLNGISLYESNPIPISKSGSISSIVNSDPNIIFYRLGKEKVWMNNFEDEGSSLWNLNSPNEEIQDSITRRGVASVQHKRSSDSPDNIITDLEQKIPINNYLSHTIHGFVRTKNGKEVTLEVRSSTNRSGGTIETTSMNDSINGDTPWTKYWGNISIPPNTQFVNIRMNSSVPDSGFAYSWFDDVGLIEWDSIQSLSSTPIEIMYPNNYNYIKVYSSQVFEEGDQITLQNSTLGSFSELRSIPISNNPIITVPNIFYFQEESQGAVGNKYWNFNNQSILDPVNPYYYCITPGVYEVQLLISGLNQQEDISSITVVALGSDSVLNDIGDINGDGVVSLLDVLICSNSILGFSDLGPEEFISSDLDHNGIIDLYDILSIIELIN